MIAALQTTGASELAQLQAELRKEGLVADRAVSEERGAQQSIENAEQKLVVLKRSVDEYTFHEGLAANEHQAKGAQMLRVVGTLKEEHNAVVHRLKVESDDALLRQKAYYDGKFDALNRTMNERFEEMERTRTVEPSVASDAPRPPTYENVSPKELVFSTPNTDVDIDAAPAPPPAVSIPTDS